MGTRLSAEQLRGRADAEEQRLRLGVAKAKGRQLRMLERSMRERARRGGRSRGVGGRSGGGMYALSGGYEAATRTRTSSGRGRTRGGSVDSFLDPQTLDFLRRDGRALMRNNPLARGMVRRCIEMIAGGRGFTAHPQSGDEAWDKAASEWWSAWWHDKREVDARKLMNGDELLKSAIRQVLVDGDVLCVPLSFGALQFVDGQRIVNPQGKGNDKSLVNGVEVDRLGAPRAFHVGLWTEAGTVAPQTQAVAAEDAWLLVRPDWVSQTRGEPRLGAVADDFERIRDFVDTTLTAAQTAAMITGIINQEDPAAGVFGLPTETQTSDTDGSSQDVGDIEPGMWMRLKNGEKWSQAQAEHPTTTFESFVINLVRFVGQELDLPLEIALLHSGLANFAAAKAMLTICLQSIDSWQEWCVWNFLQPVYEWRIEMAIADGELPAPVGDAEGYRRVLWTPPAKPNLDPQSQAQTNAMLSGGKFKTRAAIAAETGDDWRAVIDQCAAEEEYIKAKGLTVSPMPGAGGMPTGNVPAPGQNGGTADEPSPEDAQPAGKTD